MTRLTASRAALQRRAGLLAYAHTISRPDAPPRSPGRCACGSDTWAGVGRIIEAMARTGFDVQLTRYGGARLAGEVLRAPAAEHAPTISDLSVTVLTPLVLGHLGVYEFRAHFFDPDADLDGGACAVDTSVGSAAVPLSASDTASGTVICRFETTVLGQMASGVFSITDDRGHVSNGLGFAIPAEGRRAR